MGFINWFGKNTKKQEHNINGEVQDGTEELAPYSGMKVEVTTLGGRSEEHTSELQSP